MLASCASTLSKKERICSKKQIDGLFGGGYSKSITAYPVRVIYAWRSCSNDEPQAMVMVSVSKRFFKHAVKRNRIKRQLREAYRKNKKILIDSLSNVPDKGLSMAFLWIDDKMYDSCFVEKQVCDLLMRIKEKI